MRAILGDNYKPCPILRKMFLAGEMGESAGKGFYEYNNINQEQLADIVLRDKM